MRILLKDCGMDGMCGSVERCDECERPTAHFAARGGRPVCGVCGCVGVRRAAPERVEQFAIVLHSRFVGQQLAA